MAILDENDLEEGVVLKSKTYHLHEEINNSLIVHTMYINIINEKKYFSL